MVTILAAVALATSGPHHPLSPDRTPHHCRNSQLARLFDERDLFTLARHDALKTFPRGSDIIKKLDAMIRQTDRKIELVRAGRHVKEDPPLPTY